MHSGSGPPSWTDEEDLCPQLLNHNPSQESTGVGNGPSWCRLPLWAGPFAMYRGQAVDQGELSKTATQPTCIESCRPVLRGLALPGIVTGAHNGLLWGT